MRQKITKYRLFKGPPGSEDRWVKDSLNHCQVWSSTVNLKFYTWMHFQRISNSQLVHERLHTPGSKSFSIYFECFKCFKIAARSRTTSHTGIPGPLESCTSCFPWLRCSTTPAFPILPGTTKILIITYRRLQMTKNLYDQSHVFFPILQVRMSGIEPHSSVWASIKIYHTIRWKNPISSFELPLWGQ